MLTKNFTLGLIILLSGVLLSSCASLHLKDGKTAYGNLEYQDAIYHLEKGLSKKEDIDARRELASTYFNINEFQKAKEQYDLLIADNGASDDDRIRLGRTLMAIGNYDDAEDVFKGILSRNPANSTAQTLKSSCKNIGELKQDSSLWNVKPIVISDLMAVYSPVVQGNEMYLTGIDRKITNKDPYTGLSYTDLYKVSQEGDSWIIPTKVAGVNSKYHDGVASLSENGNTMVLTRSNYGTGSVLQGNNASVSTTQLYISEKDAEGNWSTPILLPFNDEKYMYAHPSLSKDGSQIVFASDQGGGFGGMDLWQVSKIDSTWGTPTNLGAVINTAANELFPTYVSADTLYFSSNGHTTLGGLDILYSVDHGNGWTGPFHLSYPLNSSKDDFGMTFTSSDKGYFSSDRSGQDALYSFEHFRPQIVLKGLVAHQKGNNPITGAAVLIKNLTDGTEELVYTDEVGMFEAALVPGKDYELRIEKDEFFAITEPITTKNILSNEELNRTFPMLEISNSDGDAADNGDGDGQGNSNDTGSGDGANNGSSNNNGSGNGSGDGDATNAGTGEENNPHKIPNILWDYNKWEIRPDAIPYLDNVVKLLKDNREYDIEIASHCDSRGSNPFNDELSQKRAKAVVDYLIKKGISRERLISKGYGKRHLLNNCVQGVECTEAQHQINRRTEFKVIE